MDERVKNLRKLARISDDIEDLPNFLPQRTKIRVIEKRLKDRKEEILDVMYAEASKNTDPEFFKKHKVEDIRELL